MSPAARHGVQGAARWLLAPAAALVWLLAGWPAVGAGDPQGAPARAVEAPPAAPWVVAPYLADLDDQSVTIGFELAAPALARVELRTDDGLLSAQSSSPRTLHLLTVPGLRPGRRYAYAVSVGDEGPSTRLDDPRHSFHTPALPGEAFVFAVYGDPRPGGSQSHAHHRRVVSGLVQSRPSFSLALGDLVDEGHRPEQWRRFLELQAPLLGRSAVFPVLGDNDHAGGAGVGPRYLPALSLPYYERSWGGVRLFALRAWDTRGAQPARTFDPGSAQARWLQGRLADPLVQAAPFRMVFLHDPVFIARGRAAPLLQRTFAPLLEQGRVDLVFASWHLYERSQRNGVVYVISGGAGAEILALPRDPVHRAQVEALQHHFCRVEVQPGALTVHAVAEDGTVLDRFTLTPRGRQRADPPARRALRRLATAELLGHGQDERPLEAVVFVPPGERGWRALRRGIDAWGGREERGVWTRRLRITDRGALELLLQAEHVLTLTPEPLPLVFPATPFDGRLTQIPSGPALLADACARLGGAGALGGGWRHGVAGAAYPVALALLVLAALLGGPGRGRWTHLAGAWGYSALALPLVLAAAGPALGRVVATTAGRALLLGGPAATLAVAAVGRALAQVRRRPRIRHPGPGPGPSGGAPPAVLRGRRGRWLLAAVAATLALPAGIAGVGRAGVTVGRALAVLGPRPQQLQLVLAYGLGFAVSSALLAAAPLFTIWLSRAASGRWRHLARAGLLLAGLSLSAAMVYTLLAAP